MPRDRQSFRERRRAAAERRLNKYLDRAVSAGAMSQAEANEMQIEAGAVSYLVIIEIILMIIEMIKDFRDKRDEE